MSAQIAKHSFRAPPQINMLPHWSFLCVVRDQVGDLFEWSRAALSSANGDWELIIADIGSTDGTRELATSLAEMDPRIRVLASPCQDWLKVSEMACDRSLGDFLVIQLPNMPLPDLDLLNTAVFDRHADLLDLDQVGGCGLPACRRGTWIRNALASLRAGTAERLCEHLVGQGARLSVCQPSQI